MHAVRTTRGPLVAALFAFLACLALAPPARGDAADWPRRFDSAGGSFVVYQPQPEELRGDLLTGRMAFSLQKQGEASPTFGVLWFQSRVDIDRDSSTVDQRDLDVTLVRLPGTAAEDAKRYETLVEAEARGWDLGGSLAELQAGLAASAQERASVEDLDHDPPRIVFTYQRSLLVVFDGDPVREPIEGTRLERVSNTPYAIVYDPGLRTYFLSGASLWYAARDPLGPWSVTTVPPAEVVAAVPPDTSAADTVQGAPPAIVTATEPTELIACDGEPLLAPLVGDRLLYVTNTESDVLRDVDTRQIYVLLSGRWYVAASEQGPWKYVPADQLPDVFRQISPDSPRGEVLASVSGTVQADDALADDEIPQTSAIRRDDHDAAATWDGQPQFEAIPGTYLQYGVNTDDEVLYDGARYFLCDQGVWYVADGPDGPWSVSVEAPDGLDALPPSCPVYNLRWVEIYDVTPDVVYVGYLPGYLGYYPCRGTVVFGTGYRYKPWRGRRHYYPRLMTWGFHARYNPWLSRWSFGYSYGAVFLRVGTRWRPDHDPAPHRDIAPWFGPGGYHRPWLADNRTLLRTPPARRHVRRPADATPVSLYNRSGNTGRVVRFKSPSDVHLVSLHPRVAPVPNNVFAGRDGKVYQRSPGGQWNVNDGTRWVRTRLPAAAPVPIVARPVPIVPRPAPVAVPVSPGGTGDESRQRNAIPKPLPAPVPVAPVAPQVGSQPTFRPREPVRPLPPTPAPTPGSLERDFQARQRAIGQVQPRPVAPVAPPARPAEPRRAETPRKR